MKETEMLVGKSTLVWVYRKIRALEARIGKLEKSKDPVVVKRVKK